jgi:hypothetical protein
VSKKGTAVKDVVNKCPFTIGRVNPCDQNRRMAASTAVRSSMGLTFRLSRVIRQCSASPFYRLNSCVDGFALLSKQGFPGGLQTLNRQLQTTMGELQSVAIL